MHCRCQLTTQLVYILGSIDRTAESSIFPMIIACRISNEISGYRWPTAAACRLQSCQLGHYEAPTSSHTDLDFEGTTSKSQFTHWRSSLYTPWCCLGWQSQQRPYYQATIPISGDKSSAEQWPSNREMTLLEVKFLLIWRLYWGSRNDVPQCTLGWWHSAAIMHPESWDKYTSRRIDVCT